MTAICRRPASRGHNSARVTLRVAATVAATVLAGLWASVTPAAGATPTGHGAGANAISSQDWAAYLNGPLHSSYTPAETAITPASAHRLVRKWHDFAGSAYYASPTVVDGAVYIGADTGWFYKLDASTGQVLYRVFTGYEPAKTCPGYGTVATATVAPDPVSHNLMVYVAGADGYLYALVASNLRVQWQSRIATPSATVNSYFDWSSPTVANGEIYIGVASNCDNPLVRAALIGYRQASGKRFARFYTVPRGDIGVSIWSSVAVAADGDVFASTGNGPESNQLLGYSESILKLSPTLKLLGKFQIPASEVISDGDFGASPVLFEGLVGACNKSGWFYVLQQSTMKLAWKDKVSGGSDPVTGCVAAPVFDGHHLFIATTAVRIGKVSYRGSIQERDPATGKLVWETGLPNGVVGSPTMDGGGVLTVSTYDISPAPNATFLVDASTGKILRRLVVGDVFAQSVFAENWLFTANFNGVYAWGLPG